MGHLEAVEHVGGVGIYEHSKRVGIVPLVDGLQRAFVQPILPHVLLALLEPLGLIERHAVQAPAHQRHAHRQDLFHPAFG